MGKWFVIGQGFSGEIMHSFDYPLNATREFNLLLQHPQTYWLLLIHYDGKTVELIKQKKLK